jgi:hypothetical protein
LAALGTGFFRNRKLEDDQRQIIRLLVIADEAMKADMSELMTLETEFRAIVASCVNKLATESGATDQAPVSIAIEHARRSIEGRKKALGANAVQNVAASRAAE